MTSTVPRSRAGTSAGNSAGRLRGVEEAIRRRVSARAANWFADVGEGAPVHLVRLVVRPRAVLYAVRIGDADGAPRVLAKLRRDWPSGADPTTGGARPRLIDELLPASDQTALEYRGLTAIHQMVDPDDPAFGAVRPLDLLVAENTILMDFVPAETLRDVLVRRNRLHALVPGGARRADGPWRNAGAWLRLFQERMPTTGLPSRQATRADVVHRLEAFGDYLTGRLGARAVGDTPRRAAALATDVLPEVLRLAPGHGDYAPRNVFHLDDGRLAVFDPMPRWLVPRFEDLCRFLAAFRLQGLQLHSHGRAYSPRETDRREHELIDGYLGADRTCLPELRCHQALITLDKWCALVDTAGTGRGARLRATSLAWTSPYIRAELQRELDLAESGRL